MYSSGTSESQIRCLMKSRRQCEDHCHGSLSTSGTISLCQGWHSIDSIMAGLVLMTGTDIQPFYFFIVLLQIKLNKNTSAIAIFQSSKEPYTAGAEFKVSLSLALFHHLCLFSPLRGFNLAGRRGATGKEASIWLFPAATNN